MGFIKTSPIQELTLRPILENKDVFAQAETGSGKTGAFAIPVIEKILRVKSEDANAKTEMNYIVLSPTRELAQQTHKVFVDLGGTVDIKSCCVIGGENIDRQKKSIQDGASVIVATPGRLCDLIKQKVVNLNNCKMMVFDEADRLFDMGFQKEIEFILRKTSKDRQLIMLSATSNQEVMRTAYKFHSQPEELKLNEDSLMVDHVQHKLAMVSSDEKFPLLVNLLRKKEDAYAIVFCNTQVQTHTVAEWLMKMGLKAKPISGRLAQNKRTSLLADFRSKKTTILVCTDVAARGLDIKDVNFVINYDLPQEAASYVHRIGRTGRAGKEGEAISFCAYEDAEHLDGIKELIDGNIERLDLENEDFATDICPKPRIDYKTLKLAGSRDESRKSSKKEGHVKKDRAPREEKKDFKNNTNKKPDRKTDRKTERLPDVHDRTRFFELAGYSDKELIPQALKYFRLKDEDLIAHEIGAEGSRKFFFFGPKKIQYKFYVKPNYKKILLPFLITLIKKAQLKLYVKVSIKGSNLYINFSGADEELLSNNRDELLKSFEQFTMVYLNSRLAVHPNLKITVKGGNSKLERVKSAPRDDKALEARLNKLAASKRKLVLEKKEAVMLKPLNANERRLIHQFFQDDKEVTTSSVGDGRLKKVRIELT